MTDHSSKDKFSASVTANYHFVEEEVLSSQEQIDERQETLYKAMVLGNSYNRKARIKCATDTGYEYITGKIRAISNNRITFEGGFSMPIKAIESVEIF